MHLPCPALQPREVQCLLRTSVPMLATPTPAPRPRDPAPPTLGAASFSCRSNRDTNPSVCFFVSLCPSVFPSFLPPAFLSVLGLQPLHSSLVSPPLSPASVCLCPHLSVHLPLCLCLHALFSLLGCLSGFLSVISFTSSFYSQVSWVVGGWAAGQGGKHLSSRQKMGQLKPQGCSGSRTRRKQK